MYMIVCQVSSYKIIFPNTICSLSQVVYIVFMNLYYNLDVTISRKAKVAPSTDVYFWHGVQLPGDASELFPERQGGGGRVGFCLSLGSCLWLGQVLQLGRLPNNMPLEVYVVIAVCKEFPLEVKADCAIKLQLEAFLGQGYQCDVSSLTYTWCYPRPCGMYDASYHIGEDK